jgi:hypothetical protein
MYTQQLFTRCIHIPGLVVILSSLRIYKHVSGENVTRLEQLFSSALARLTITNFERVGICLSMVISSILSNLKGLQSADRYVVTSWAMLY